MSESKEWAVGTARTNEQELAAEAECIRLRAQVEQLARMNYRLTDRLTGARDEARATIAEQARRIETATARIDQLELNGALRLREAVEPRDARITTLEQALRWFREHFVAGVCFDNQDGIDRIDTALATGR